MKDSKVTQHMTVMVCFTSHFVLVYISRTASSQSDMKWLNPALQLCLRSVDTVNSEFGFIEFWWLFGFLLGFPRFAVNLIKFSSDLQHRAILGLGDVEPHIEPAAEAEDQENEEAEVFQILLRRRQWVSWSDAFNHKTPVPSLLVMFSPYD